MIIENANLWYHYVAVSFVMTGCRCGNSHTEPCDQVAALEAKRCRLASEVFAEMATATVPNIIAAGPGKSPVGLYV